MFPQCGGPSMLPTLADSGDWVAYETFSLRSQRLGTFELCFDVLIHQSQFF
jgi:signal peptidase I